MKVACVIPVHDEAAILEENAKRVLAWGTNAFGQGFTLVISENGSTDETAELARRLGAILVGCIAITSKEPGKGGAIKRAAEVVEADVYLMLDADMSTDLASAELLIDAVVSGADIAIGSRRLPSSRVRRPWYRRLTTVVYSAVAQAVLGLGIRDLQCGCKAFSRSVRDGALRNVRDDGFFFDTELLVNIQEAGGSIKEVGIVWAERDESAGKSKVSLFKDGWVFLRKMAILRKRLGRHAGVLHKGPSAYEKALRQALPPAAVFVLAAAFYLLTFTPSIWYADAFNYLVSGIAWHHGGFTFQHAPMSYPGWVAFIALLPAAQRTSPAMSLELILGAKLLSIFFSAAAAAGMYLTAKRLFASKAFAFIAAALFAANPLIWLEGQSALSDVPALAFMTFSLFFFVRFYQERKFADVAIASVLAGAAAVVRVQSLLILLPYAIGILMIGFEAPDQSLMVRLKRILPLGVVMCTLVFALPLVFFGMPPWILSSTVPLSIPRLDDLLVVVKWYVARDIGWFWFLLAWTGIAVGLYRRETRTFALMFIAFIAVGVSYFASMNAWLGADIPRYLLPTIPFTLLGMGFLWPVGRMRMAKAALSLLVFAYAASVFTSLRSPSAPEEGKRSIFAKIFFLQQHLASDAARTYARALPGMMTDMAMETVLPDDAVVVLPDATLVERHFHVRRVTSPIMIVNVMPRLPASERFQGLSSIPGDRPVFVYPGPDSAAIQALLVENGFTPRGEVGGYVMFRKDQSAS